MRTQSTYGYKIVTGVIENTGVMAAFTTPAA
jgi:hypothetical protein